MILWVAGGRGPGSLILLLAETVQEDRAPMQLADIGVYGLGRWGAPLRSISQKWLRVAVSNRESDWIAPFLDEAGPMARGIVGHARLADFGGWA